MQSSAPLQKKKLLFHKGKSLSEYATLGIGGPAQFLTTVTTANEAVEALQFAERKQIPFFVLGKGSNSLFDDRGFAGLVIVNQIAEIAYDGSLVTVGGGYNFSLLGVQTARKGLSGLEFASGIPGSVGGAIYMNAGAGGHETKDALTEVVFLTKEGSVRRFRRDELTFSYRTSPFQQMEGVIVEATFALEENPKARETQIEIVKYRTSTQPYGTKNAGCVFRNPKSQNAGALIDACGLKGKRVGDAVVSGLHANFLINDGSATQKEFCALIKEIQDAVLEKTGEQLKTEVRQVPYDISR